MFEKICNPSKVDERIMKELREFVWDEEFRKKQELENKEKAIN